MNFAKNQLKTCSYDVNLNVCALYFDMSKMGINLDVKTILRENTDIFVLLLANYHKQSLDKLLQDESLINYYEFYHSGITDFGFILVLSNDFIDSPRFLYSEKSLVLSFTSFSTNFLVACTKSLQEVLNMKIDENISQFSRKSEVFKVKDLANLIIGTTMKNEEDFIDTYIIQEPPANFKPTGVYLAPKIYDHQVYAAKLYFSNYFQCNTYDSLPIYSKYQPVIAETELKTIKIDFEKLHEIIEQNIEQWSHYVRNQLQHIKVQNINFGSINVNERQECDLMIDAESEIEFNFIIPDVMQQFFSVSYTEKVTTKSIFRVTLLLTEQFIQQNQIHSFEPKVYIILLELKKMIPEIQNEYISYYKPINLEFQLNPSPFGLNLNNLSYVDENSVNFGRKLELNSNFLLKKPQFPEIIMRLIRMIDINACALLLNEESLANLENLINIIKFEGFHFKVQEMSSLAGYDKNVEYYTLMLVFKVLHEIYINCQSAKAKQITIEETAECIFGDATQSKLAMAKEWLDEKWRIKMRYFV